jgi:extracellular factor (EF) 3-hydroxypalmitic acid methyl ester biosynthesis protein
MAAELSILDSLHSQFLDRDVQGGIRRFGIEMRALKSSLSEAAWNNFVRVAPQHPVWDIVHQDPFTHHSFTKPRGYSGDADLLDYIYGHRPIPPETTEEGREIFSYTARTAPAPTSVQERISRIAGKIDEISIQFPAARVLSVACGHLREAELSDAFQNRRLGCLAGVDVDTQSLAQVSRRLRERPDVTIFNSSINHLLGGRLNGKGYHLVYSLGLYDYLEDRFATRLTAGLFELLVRDGILLIANFMPHLHDAGYMEAFMAWRLIYRTRDELFSLLDRVDKSQISEMKTYIDTGGNLAYLEVVRR